MVAFGAGGEGARPGLDRILDGCRPERAAAVRRLAAERHRWHLEADSEHKVVGFSVDGARKEVEVLRGKPVLAFEEMVDSHPPDRVKLLVAIGLLSLLVATFEYRYNMRTLGADYAKSVRSLSVIGAPLKNH